MSAPVKPTAAASRVAAAREAAKAAKKKPGPGAKKEASVKETSPCSLSPNETGEEDSVKELPESDQNLALLNIEASAEAENENPGENSLSNEESRC